MQASSDATSSESMLGNIATRNWLRPSLRYGSVSTIAVRAKDRRDLVGVDVVAEVDRADDGAAICGVGDEGRREVRGLGPGVEDLCGLTRATRREGRAAVVVHPGDLRCQEVDRGEGRRVVGLIES